MGDVSGSGCVSLSCCFGISIRLAILLLWYGSASSAKALSCGPQKFSMLLSAIFQLLCAVAHAGGCILRVMVLSIGSIFFASAGTNHALCTLGIFYAASRYVQERPPES